MMHTALKLKTIRPLSLVCVMAPLLALTAINSLAQSIRTDASWGRTAKPLIGPAYDIPESLGKLAGNNLFHSFQVFNVNAGESAIFSTTTATLQNVISRVSGGSASSINGLLQLTPAAGSAPAFFFINPAGVTFGAGASVNVPGAFHVSTANHLKLSDGTLFRAGNGPDSTFSIAPPEAFGFLGTTRAAITVKEGTELWTQPTQPIGLAGGDIVIDKAVVGTYAADIRATALGTQPADWPILGKSASPGGPPIAPDGTMTITNGGGIAALSSGALSAGNIEVRAGTLTIDGRGSTDGTGIIDVAIPGSSGSAGSVDVTVSGAASILNGGQISSSTFSSGNAGTVKLTAGSLTIDGQGSTNATGIFDQANSGTGSAGSIDVAVSGAASILNGGVISSRTSSSGSAGTVKLNAGSLTIDRQGSTDVTGIVTRTESGTGSAGNVEVVVSGAASIVNGGVMSTSTSSSGNAGMVKLTAGSLIIDGQGSTNATGIFNQANSGSSGSAGNIDVMVSGTALILNRGLIISSTFSSGNAGTVTFGAHELTIDGKDYVTGILDGAQSGIGSAGNIEVTVSGEASILKRGLISSSTFSSGNAGTVKLTAGSLTIDGQGSPFVTGITNEAQPDSSGSAGSVDVMVSGAASILHGGKISSSTYSSGNAGTITLTAGSLTIDGQGSTNATGIFGQANSFSSGLAGNIDVSVSGAVSILNGGQIDSSTFSSGSAGMIKLNAGSMSIDGQSSDGQGSTNLTGIIVQAQSDSGNSGSAGSVEVTVSGAASILNGGVISSSTSSSGNAGTVKLNTGSLIIDGRDSIYVTGIFDQAYTGGSGSAGNIQVTVSGAASILHGGKISSSTYSSGNAGAVTLTAGSLTIDGQGSKFSTGIVSEPESLFVPSIPTGSAGSTGGIEVTVNGAALILNGARISGSTSSSHNAGTVKLNAGSLTIDGQGSTDSTGIFDQANSGTGSAGSIDVVVSGAASILKGGLISSSTQALGDAGSVIVKAGSITIDGGGVAPVTGIGSEAAQGSSGKAGSVEVSAAGSLSIVGGGGISSRTRSKGTPGDGGSVKVSAGSITIDRAGGPPTGISSDALEGRGNAGRVDVLETGNLSILNGGQISSNTSGQGNAGTVEVSVTGNLFITNSGLISSDTDGPGNAGSVNVSASRLLVDGALSSISASAQDGSSGQTGNVSVKAADSITLSNGGFLSISNAATVANSDNLEKTRLVVSAPNIVLKDAQITAASSGNVAASDIDVYFTDRLSLDPSSITTSANAGNGGSIGIQGGNIIVLDNSQITTSVSGLNGNGGNISVTANFMLMNTGFIQANTAASKAFGGNVSINVGTLIPSGNTLLLGGGSAHVFTPGVFGFNVIEAAAPSGLSGNIQVSSPALDLSGALGGLSTATIDFGALGKDPCRVSAGSSLTSLGRGGLPPAASGAIRPEHSLAAPALALNPVSTTGAQLPILSAVRAAKSCS